MSTTTTTSTVDRTDAHVFASVKALGASASVERVAAHAGLPLADVEDAIERLGQRRVVEVYRPLDAAGRQLAVHVKARAVAPR